MGEKSDGDRDVLRGLGNVVGWSVVLYRGGERARRPFKASPLQRVERGVGRLHLHSRPNCAPLADPSVSADQEAVWQGVSRGSKEEAGGSYTNALAGGRRRSTKSYLMMDASLCTPHLLPRLQLQPRTVPAPPPQAARHRGALVRTTSKIFKNCNISFSTHFFLSCLATKISSSSPSLQGRWSPPCPSR